MENSNALTIQYLSEGYANHTFSIEDIIDQVLASVEAAKSHNIWITPLSKSQIMAYVDALSSKDPSSLPLYGVPFAIKDNIDLANVLTTAGCEAFGYTPSKSAYVVQQLIDAGAIPIGKTNMDQFATGLVGTRAEEKYGQCKNSFDPEYISGGSSSGSAVAVAKNICTFSLGTDTAGSGRVPASLNNIVGLKPSKGLLSMTGVVPACRSLDCVSIFTLNTDDAITVLNVAASFDNEDQYARENAASNHRVYYGQSTEDKVIGIPKADQLKFFGDDDVNEAFSIAKQQVAKAGFKVIEVDISPFLEAANLLYGGPWVAERYLAVKSLIESNPDALLPVTRKIIEGAKPLLATDVFDSMYKLQKFKAQADKLMHDVDAFMTPTNGAVYKIDEVNADPIQLNTNLGYYTNFMNLLDCAAVAIPTSKLPSGIPWGITLFHKAHTDVKLLTYGRKILSNLNLPMGTTSDTYKYNPTTTLTPNDHTDVVVCGAHLQGLPLNWQLTTRNAVLVKQAKTAPCYRMYALPGKVKKPGLIRDNKQGKSIDVEVWRMPTKNFGSFVTDIPAPLGIGKVELEDGEILPSFICEPYIIPECEEITEYGSWRRFVGRG